MFFTLIVIVVERRFIMKKTKTGIANLGVITDVNNVNNDINDINKCNRNLPKVGHHRPGLINR